MVTTRNRASKTCQSGDSDKDSSRADDNKGAKRKRKTSSGDQSENVDIENEPDKRRAKLEKEEKEKPDESICQQSISDEATVCSCRPDVMKCIGILPSLPIMNQYYDSDDSESDLEDYAHTVLPIVDRNANKQQGTES